VEVGWVEVVFDYCSPRIEKADNLGHSESPP
jgi:hypothetical protein